MTTAILLTLLAAPAPAAQFGAPITSTLTVTMADALSRPEDYKGMEIVLEGKVAKVCQNKGCWMVLDDGERDVRLTFKDYKFSVPKDCAGKTVRAQGAVFRETLSVKTVRHFMKDAGASKEELKKVTRPQETVSFVASGVSFLDPVK